MAAPSRGIEVFNDGGFVCQFRVKTNGKETELSGNKALAEGARWSYEELIGSGFKEGDNCWVSVDIVAGKTNHESGGNFLLKQDAGVILKYSLSGAVLTPSWDGPIEPAAVIIHNNGWFIGRMRVKTAGKDSNQSGLVSQWKGTSWTFSELASQGFKKGDDCWVSVDIEAGKTNHESGDNFTLEKGAAVTYDLTGGVWNPSWSKW
jgi:hypothetical protein